MGVKLALGRNKPSHLILVFGVIMIRQPVAYYMLCRDKARVAQWQERIKDIPGVKFHLWTGFQSMYAFILQAIGACSEPFLVVAHDDVVIGRDFADRVYSLVDELGESPAMNWGVVGNAGVGVEGKTHIYVRDPWCVPEQAHGPDIVATIDGNLMLINRVRYFEAGCEFPDLGGFHGYDVVLSLECLRKGLLVLTDGRLRAVHLSGGNRGAYEEYIKSRNFQHYFQTRFSDRRIPTMMGLQDILSGFGGEAAGDRPALRDLQRMALVRVQSNRKCRLGIVDCRSMTGGLAVDLPSAATDLIDIETVVVCEGDGVSPSVAGRVFLNVPVGARLADLVREAFLQLPYDYLWFMTDPLDLDVDILPCVARTLANTSDPLLLVGTYRIQFIDGRVSDEFKIADFLRAVFTCKNFPLSTLFIPVQPLREAMRQGVLGGFADNGALIGALALTVPGISLIPIPANIMVVDRPDVIPPNPGAYGKEADWNYVERLGYFDAVAARANPFVWQLAGKAALASPPAAIVRWAQAIWVVWQAGRQVLGSPRRYLARGLLLAFRYLSRGDIQGLVREAGLFRPR